MKKEKIKEWFSEHKNVIEFVVVYVVSFAIGFVGGYFVTKILLNILPRLG